VKPLDFPLLADENIGVGVVDGLRSRKCDLRTVQEEQLLGASDREVLERATSQQRVVVTHDLGFAKSAIRAGDAFVGIVYLRPGHISADFVLAIVDALRESAVEVRPPFIVVAERRDAVVRVRTRSEPPW
jgi:predicted nuclease of predicted toxin-antitoxin system